MNLDLFIGIVAAAWLLIIGSWKIVLLSFIAVVISPKLLEALQFIFALLPAFIALKVRNNRSFNWLSYLCSFISTSIGALIMSVWGILIYASFIKQASTQTILPLYILSYFMATIPFARIASKQAPPCFCLILNLWFQIAYLLLLVILSFIVMSSLKATVILFLIMQIPVLINLCSYIIENESESKYLRLVK